MFKCCFRNRLLEQLERIGDIMSDFTDKMAELTVIIAANGGDSPQTKAALAELKTRMDSNDADDTEIKAAVQALAEALAAAPPPAPEPSPAP